MRSLAHRQVAEAVDALLVQAPAPETCGSFHDLQWSLVQESRKYERNDLINAAIRDAWFLGYWALKSDVQMTDETARNLVAPASLLCDVYWRRAKKELSTATGVINPFFMDLSPTMINLDPDTDLAIYNNHAERIIGRNAKDQSNDKRIVPRDLMGCPHGITGMSRFLLSYLGFMNTHVTQSTPTAPVGAPEVLQYSSGPN